MDISFESESLRYFEALPPAMCSHEETTEIIVPDAMPDVGSILLTEGCALLRGKEAQKEKLLVSGVCDLCVLYMPEEGGTLRRLSLEAPFEALCDYPGLGETARSVVSLRLMSAESRMLNSRKLLLRWEVLVTGRAYLPRQLRRNVRCAGDTQLEVRQETGNFSPVTEVTEKTFSAGEEFLLPAGKAGVEQVLHTRLRLLQEESSAVGAKLILRGSLTADICYLGSDGRLTSAEFRTPYSVILELEGSREGSTAEAEVSFTGLHVDASEPGSITLEVGAVAQAVLRSPMQLSWISDAYSTKHAMEGSYETAVLESDVQHSGYEDSVRIVLDGLQTPGNVADVSLMLAKPRQEEGQCKVSLTARVLCCGEDGRVSVLSGRGEARCPLPAAGEGLRIQPGSVSASVTGSGAEVRVPVSFRAAGGEKKQLVLLSQAKLDSERPAGDGEAPSVSVLRMAEGDSLWFLGKRRAVSQQLLRQLNELGPEEQPEAGQLLLIARQR